ncbi:MAG: hypothetical protein ACI9YM_002523 [Brevundimonas sp.]|uniref:hypothetical protein n=1 Tax=Brevundimonas sp. TaxID=1871086 RepID=UPI0039E72848
MSVATGWKQLGRIFVPDGALDWSRTHAQAPAAVLMDDRIRVYYGTRNAENRSRTGFIEVDRADPTRLLHVHDRPVMDLGKPGTHDEDGVIASQVITVGDELWMYYGGVSRGGHVPYRMSIGLARSRDAGLTFERVFDGPVVDRTPDEPYMTMAPNIIVEDGVWTMWYGSGTGWVEIDGKFEPTYQIKLAHSDDGQRWRQTNHACIPKLDALEANTRPSVMRTPEGFEMWFSYRNSREYRDGSGSYRIGYATSTDGRDWTRQPDPDGLQPTGEGWNSATMSYPSVIAADGRKIMFHNGDGFGQSGIGCAILETA